MARYAIVTEIKTEANEVEWWMDQTDSVEFLQIFDSFEEAKKEMRTAIRKIAKASKFFPLKGDKYEPIEEYCEPIKEYYGSTEEYGVDIKRLGEIVSNTIRREDYFCEEPDLDIRDTDDSNWYFALVANKDLVLVDYCGKTLKMNVHNMTDTQKQYYFDYTECDDDGRVINSISVGLYREGKTRSQKVEAEAPNYETAAFGRYIQDKEGKEFSPLSWYVLEKKEDMALLVTEKIIDYIRFSANGENNWEKSDILRWLNEDFAACSFSEQERDLIKNSSGGKKIFLLSTEEYKKYFSDPKDARAGFTDYSRGKIEEHCRAKMREPYGFWWLRSANEAGGLHGDGSGSVYHVCNTGKVNCFQSAEGYDGVRPAIWVKWDNKLTDKNIG